MRFAEVRAKSASQCPSASPDLDHRPPRLLQEYIEYSNAEGVPTSIDVPAGLGHGPPRHLPPKLCHPHLLGDGCIVNLASTSARRWDAAGYGAYATTKEAIRALTRAAASEWGKDIGEVVAFLCSDAASYVGGQSIAIDKRQAYIP